MSTSLKERMDMFKKSAGKSGTDDHQAFKRKSGNKEQPSKVGKLNHSYLEKDDKAQKPKRNFRMSGFGKKKKDEDDVKAKQKQKEEEEAKAKASKAKMEATAAKPKKEEAETPKSPTGRKPGKLKNSFFSNDNEKKEDNMNKTAGKPGKLRNPFLNNDKKRKSEPSLPKKQEKVEKPKEDVKREPEATEETNDPAKITRGKPGKLRNPFLNNDKKRKSEPTLPKKEEKVEKPKEDVKHEPEATKETKGQAKITPGKPGKLRNPFLKNEKNKATPKKEKAENSKSTLKIDTKAVADGPNGVVAPRKSAIRIPKRLSSKMKNAFLSNDKSKKKEEAESQKKKKEKEEAKKNLEEEEIVAELKEEDDSSDGDAINKEKDKDESGKEPTKQRSLFGKLKQASRRSLGIFGREKTEVDEFSSLRNGDRNFISSPINVNQSKAREKAGIKLTLGNAKPPPRKSLSLLKRFSSRGVINNNQMNAYNLVVDKSRADEVEEYLNKITQFNKSFKLMKRLSIRDNDIVQAIQKVIGNDSRQTEIMIDGDVRFGHLRSSMVQDFGDSIRNNLYLKSLTIRGVELGNTFLEALTSAIRDNVTLEVIDLSRNLLTHEAMVEFCQALEHNHTIEEVYLNTQLSPLYQKGVETVLEAIEKNYSLKKMTIDFQGNDEDAYQKRLTEILKRNCSNKDEYKMPNPDDMLVSFLKEEVARVEELHKQKLLEKELEEVHEGDWDYLYELSVIFDRFKIQNEDEETKRNSIQTFASPMHEGQSKRASGGLGTQGRNPLTGAQGFPSDGSFLTEEFVDLYLQEDPERGGLVFNFCNQGRLFKQFPSTSPDRENIVNIFVYELLHHPRQQEFTGINMTNTGCGSDFWARLSEDIIEDPDMFPNIHTICAETNFITEPGIVAIANLIKSEHSMKYLQVLKLDNQKALLSSKAERALARAMCVNLSVVRFSLRVRNLLERDQCNKYIVRNIDFLRQARRHYKINTGTLGERKRNAMEQYFDSIAANDEKITEVNISADIKFTGLSDVEKVKTAKAFATNTHVTKVTMNSLQLGDKFAIALGVSLEQNNTIQRLVIEGNAFTGAGFKGLFAGLGKNGSVLELLGMHQSKSMSSPDEQALPALLEGNTTVTKISLDLRNSAVTMQLDKVCNRNRHRRISTQAPTERKRNAMEQYFDSIAANDESITEVNLSADVKFTGLSNAEKVKSAKAFATNSNVTKVTMNALQLGDDFGIALGEALEQNNTIERLVIEGNAFAGPGFKGIFDGLGKNSSVLELLGKHQTKSMSSSDEQALPGLLEENTTISKISLDLRNSAVTMALDKICSNNSSRRRKRKNSVASDTAAESAASAIASNPASPRDSTFVVPVAAAGDKPFDEDSPRPPEEEETPFDEQAPMGEATAIEARELSNIKDEQPFDEGSPQSAENDGLKPFVEELPQTDESPTAEETAAQEDEAEEAIPVPEDEAKQESDNEEPAIEDELAEEAIEMELTEDEAPRSDEHLHDGAEPMSKDEPAKEGVAENDVFGEPFVEELPHTDKSPTAEAGEIETAVQEDEAEEVISVPEDEAKQESDSAEPTIEDELVEEAIEVELTEDEAPRSNEHLHYGAEPMSKDEPAKEGVEENDAFGKPPDEELPQTDESPTADTGEIETVEEVTPAQEDKAEEETPAQEEEAKQESDSTEPGIENQPAEDRSEVVLEEVAKDEAPGSDKKVQNGAMPMTEDERKGVHQLEPIERQEDPESELVEELPVQEEATEGQLEEATEGQLEATEDSPTQEEDPESEPAEESEPTAKTNEEQTAPEEAAEEPAVQEEQSEENPETVEEEPAHEEEPESKAEDPPTQEDEPGPKIDDVEEPTAAEEKVDATPDADEGPVVQEEQSQPKAGADEEGASIEEESEDNPDAAEETSPYEEESVPEPDSAEETPAQE